MACPACLCKETYEYDDGEDYPDMEDLMRCAACGAVFPLEDEAPEEDNDQRSEELQKYQETKRKALKAGLSDDDITLLARPKPKK